MFHKLENKIRNTNTNLGVYGPGLELLTPLWQNKGPSHISVDEMTILDKECFKWVKISITHKLEDEIRNTKTNLGVNSLGLKLLTPMRQNKSPSHSSVDRMTILDKECYKWVKISRMLSL